MKAKLEKERNQFKMEAEDLQSNFEVLSKNKVDINYLSYGEQLLCP